MNAKKPWEDYDEEFEKEILEFCKIHNIKKVAKEYHFKIGTTRYIYSYNKASLSDMYTGSLPWVKPERTKVIHIKGNQKGLMDTYMQLLLSSLVPTPLSGIEKMLRRKYPREVYVEEEQIQYDFSSDIKDKISMIKDNYEKEEVEDTVIEEKPIDITQKFAKFVKSKKISSDTNIETSSNMEVKIIKKVEPIKIKQQIDPKPTVDKKKQAMEMLLKRR